MSKPISKIDLPAASRRPACRQTEQTAQVGKLIAELCPEGVEFKELAEVATITIGEFVHKNKQNPNGKYPVYNGGTSETGFYDEYNNTGNKIIMSARGANAGFVNKILDKFDALVNDTTPPLQAPLRRRGMKYNTIAENPQSTVVAGYTPDKKRATHYQSEAELERTFIEQLKSQAYEYLPIISEADLVLNLRRQLEKLNDFTFSDAEWERFFTGEIANPNQSIAEKTATIQEDYIKNLKRDDLPASRPGQCCIYVLKCSDNSFYIGQTDNYESRLQTHRNGKGAEWTKNHLPFEIPLIFQFFHNRC